MHFLVINTPRSEALVLPATSLRLSPSPFLFTPSQIGVSIKFWSEYLFQTCLPQSSKSPSLEPVWREKGLLSCLPVHLCLLPSGCWDPSVVPPGPTLFFEAQLRWHPLCHLPWLCFPLFLSAFPCRFCGIYHILPGLHAHAQNYAELETGAHEQASLILVSFSVPSTMYVMAVHWASEHRKEGWMTAFTLRFDSSLRLLNLCFSLLPFLALITRINLSDQKFQIHTLPRPTPLPRHTH